MAELQVASEVDYGRFCLRVDAKLPVDGVTGLFGPSGHGKTTLLRVIAGLERASRGRVVLDGEVWQDDGAKVFVPPHRRGVGVVFQDARLFAHLSVHGNLAFAASRRPAAHPSLEEVVDMLDLEALLEQRPAALSAGERQRVAIARALLASPRLLLMDEPLAALDLRRKAEILSYIERLRAASNLPIVYVTHSVDEISRLAAHVALMSRGRIEAVGTLEQVMRETDLRALAGHFEAGAILEGRVLSHDDAYALTAVALADQQLHMPSVDLPVGAPLRVRIRARDVALATRPPENTSIRNVLRGRITTIEPEAGAHSEIALDIGAGLLRARITRHSVDHLDLRPGQEVYALVKTVAMDRRLVRPRHPPEE